MERFGSVFRQTGRNSDYCGGFGYTGHAPLEKKTTSYEGMIGFGHTSANEAPAPNRRPLFPLGGRGELEHDVHAPPSSPAAVGEAQR